MMRQRRFAPLAWAAALCCLLAGASIHSHADGWHAPSICDLCAFEDAVAHGAAPAAPAPAMLMAWSPARPQPAPRAVAIHLPRRALIRAPPASA